MNIEDTIDESMTHTTYIEGIVEVVGPGIPDSPSPVEELPRITATYNELQDAKVIEASTEQSSPQYRVTLADLPKPPLLNRAQRRQLRKYIAHKAALQVRHVLAKRRKMAAKQAKVAKALAKQAKYVAGTIS